MQQYIVYRHGWNENNQRQGAGLPEKMPVARIGANSPEDACQRSLDQVTVHANQYLTAEPADEVDARENNLNLRAEALQRPIAP
jgi:hypothetical protein